MKVRIFRDEWYPVLEINYDDDYGREVDLPADIVTQYQVATAEFHRVHDIVRAAYDATVDVP